jgi:hypothetical protein
MQFKLTNCGLLIRVAAPFITKGRHTHSHICIRTQSEQHKTLRSTKKKMWRTTIKKRNKTGTTRACSDEGILHRATGSVVQMSVRSVTEQDRQCTCARVTSHWGAFAQVTESAYKLRDRLLPVRQSFHPHVAIRLLPDYFREILCWGLLSKSVEKSELL